MSVFEFVLLIVLIVTVGNVVVEIVESRRLPPSGPHDPELDQLRDAVNELSSRVHELEEERDFYRKLLEAPDDLPSLPSDDQRRQSSDPHRPSDD